MRERTSDSTMRTGSTYETEVRRIPSLISWRSVAPEQFEVKDARSAPPSAAALRAVLEFELLWRIMASMNSMRCWRRARRAYHACLRQDACKFLLEFGDDTVGPRRGSQLLFLRKT